MNLHLVFVGKTRFPEFDTGIARYVDRLRHYVSIHQHVVKPEKIGKKSVEASVLEEEAERILKLVEGQGYLLVWDRGGKALDSEDFARFWGKLRDDGISAIWMVVGGPLGVSSRLVARADAVLSLSRMTLPHDLARLVIVEQTYRAFTILKGEPYHK